jgi:hypothetical protein
MIRIQSNKAKRTLSTFLGNKNPEMLEFIKAFSEKFGPIPEIEYRGKGEKELRKELEAKWTK